MNDGLIILENTSQIIKD